MITRERELTKDVSTPQKEKSDGVANDQEIVASKTSDVCDAGTHNIKEFIYLFIIIYFVFIGA